MRCSRCARVVLLLSLLLGAACQDEPDAEHEVPPPAQVSWPNPPRPCSPTDVPGETPFTCPRTGRRERASRQKAGARQAAREIDSSFLDAEHDRVNAAAFACGFQFASARGVARAGNAARASARKRANSRWRDRRECGEHQRCHPRGRKRATRAPRSRAHVSRRSAHASHSAFDEDERARRRRALAVLAGLRQLWVGAGRHRLPLHHQLLTAEL